MSESSDATPLLNGRFNPPSPSSRSSPSRLRPKMVNRMSSSTPVPERPHTETHIGGFDAVMRDVIIGFSDGLTVPFALTAGLSSLGNTKIVIMGGLAELCSGMISMGLGAYLAADTERQHWYVHISNYKLTMNQRKLTPPAGKPNSRAKPPRSRRSQTWSAPRSTTSWRSTA